MSKEYLVSDLFYTSWAQLKGRTHAMVYSLLMQLREAEPGSIKYGTLLIAILRLLRKGHLAALTIDSINEEQAVDCFNELTFLNNPWYNFPEVPGNIRTGKWATPEEYLARHTFDHFIYADNEYSSFLATQDEKYLKRLVATLYQREFDKEDVETLAPTIQAKDWQLTLVFYSYAQVRDFVVKRSKTLMPKAPAMEEGTESAPTPTGPMWLKLKHRLAETPAFQGYDNAGRANMYAALDYLEDLAQMKERNGKN
jgi:hypothetical protein